MPALGEEAAGRVCAGLERVWPLSTLGYTRARPEPRHFCGHTLAAPVVAKDAVGQDEGRAVAHGEHPADPEDVDQPAPPPGELRAYVAEGRQREAPQRADGEGDVHELLVDRDPRPALHRRQLVEREPQDHRGVVEHQLPPELARNHLQYALEDEEEDLQLELLLGIDLPNHVEKQRHARERVAKEDDQIASHLRPPLCVVVKLLLVDLALLEQWLRSTARGGAHDTWLCHGDALLLSLQLEQRGFFLPRSARQTGLFTTCPYQNVRKSRRIARIAQFEGAQFEGGWNCAQHPSGQHPVFNTSRTSGCRFMAAPSDLSAMLHRPRYMLRLLPG